MSKEKRRVPKLRFPGFTEDWEQRKFLDLLDAQNGIRRGPFGSSLKKDSFVKKSDYVVYEQQNAIYDNYETRYFISKEKYNELIRFNIQPGDFIMSGAGTIGRISMVPDGIKKGVFNQALIRFKVNKDSINPLYFLKFMQSDMMQKLLTQANPGSAMTNLVPMDELKKWDVTIPSLEEQNRISTFINQIDEFITLHQRKLEHLNLKKKALLQKLFPKNGECYPELRFPGFTDAWEQCKLDDIAKIKTGGGTPKTAKPEYWSGNIPWIQSSDLVEGDITHVNINKFINNNALKNSAAKLISRDSIALVTRVGVGKVAVINQDFTTSQDFLSLSDFDRRDIKFLAYQLYRLMQENAKVLQGTSIKGITKTELIEQSILIPNSGQEQHLISNVLSKIDSIITLHQRKLDHLQLQKKALLQQMFV